MDPQQRLLLELGYGSLHISSHRRSKLLEGNIGVFLGIERPDWALAQPPLARCSVYAATSDNVSVAAGRLSFVLGLQGPCFSVDTACASALAAMHTASSAIGDGDCSQALASAIGLKLVAQGTLGAAMAGMLSISGRCKTFDRHANGYVRSEATGALVLCSEENGACAALLGSSAVRQDGRSASLTAPNGSAQCKLLRAAASRTTVEIAYTEAHGTGTALGDPTEAGALASAYGASGLAKPMGVGAAKASFGHSEAVSGQIGVQKVQMLLHDQSAMGNAHLRVLSPIVAERIGVCSRFVIPVQGMISTSAGGVSSFGYSGTIAHATIHIAGRAVLSEGRTVAVHSRYRCRVFPWREPSHPFLQQRIAASDATTALFSSAASVGTLRAIVADHVVHGRVLFPAAGYLEVARAAASTAVSLHDVFFLQPLAVEAAGLLIECAVGDGHFDVRSRVDKGDADAVVHCSGTLAPQARWQVVEHASVRGRSCVHAAHACEVYDGYDAVGVQYGPGYRTLAHAWGGPQHAAARLQARWAKSGTHVHPADLDDALCVRVLAGPSREGNGETRLPFALDEASLQGVPGGLWAAVAVQGAEAGSVRLGTLAGPAQAQVDGFRARALVASMRASACRRWHYEVEWSSCALENAPLHAVRLELLAIGPASPALSSQQYVVVQNDGEKGMLAARQWHAAVLTIALRPAAGACVDELRALDSALGLLQAQAGRGDPPPVWVCTVATQPVCAVAVKCAHAGLWGLARTCRQEQPTLPAWCIDLGGSTRGLATVIQHRALQLPSGRVRGLQLRASEEPEAACVGSALLVPRLVAPHDAQSAAVNIVFENMRQLLDAFTFRAMAELDMERLVPAYALLEAACQQYVHDAVCTVAQRSTAVPVWHHKLLHAWCAKQPPPPPSCAATLADVRAAHPDLHAEVQLAARCGPSLADALTSAVPYQELLFPGGSMEAVLPVYEDSVVSAFYNGCVVGAVEAMLSLLADERRVVALEVGAGTGGTASSVLPVVELGCERYIFTDVSEVFLRQGRARFASFAFVEYALLNIDADPALQGFGRWQHDVLLATNVLHATPFMRNTLAHCSQLLKAGGVLMVNEALQASALFQMSFGMTDGWWLFSESSDPERSGQDSPLLSQRQWQALLAASGFDDSHCMQGSAFLQAQAAIIAQSGTPPMDGLCAPLDEEGAHLLSGGLGGLGLLTARLLIEVGAQQLVLTSRSGRVVAGSEDDWAWLDTCGGDVRRVCCDASDDGAMRALARALCGDGLRLRSVFHAAHQLADATLPNQHALHFRAAYGPKVHGAAALHALSGCTPLSLFNAYSSVAGLLGSAGQAPHSAANAWLDTMTSWRRQRGMLGQSVNWGAVAGIGYAARHGADRRAEASGSGVISRAMAVGALSSTLLPACRSFAVLPAEWSKVLAGSTDARGLLSPYAHLRGHAATHSDAACVSSARTATSALGLDVVLELVRRTAGGFVDADAPLMEAGVDSLGAVELRNQLQAAAGEGKVLPSTITFDHPTARGLATLLGAEAVVAACGSDRLSEGLGEQVCLMSVSAALPGGARGLSKAWRLAATGCNAFGRCPVSRWDSDGATVRYGAFLHGAELFDHAAFGVSLSETSTMDPQQRFLLELG